MSNITYNYRLDGRNIIIICNYSIYFIICIIIITINHYLANDDDDDDDADDDAIRYE